MLRSILVFLGLIRAELKISERYLLSGKNTKSIRQKIARNIESISRKYDYYKIGKTGNPEVRVSYDDYRKNYEIMYLMFESKSEKTVSDLERFFIDEFYEDNENQSLLSGGKMRSPNGYYYLYVVAE